MITMMSKDAVAGTAAECYAVVDEKRYNMMQAIKFEAKYEKVKSEIPILGQINKGWKAAGGKGTGTMTLHYNQSIIREMLEKYQNTGEDTYFDMQVTNEDKTSAAGRQTVIFKNCNVDGGILAKFDAGAEYLDEEVAFTFELFIIQEKFKTLEGME